MSWKSLKRSLRERFLNWETFNGAFLFIPWGAGFIWYGVPTKEVLLRYSLDNERFGYNYGLVSLGAVLVVWGCRKVWVNRVKQMLKREYMVIQRHQANPNPPVKI